MMKLILYIFLFQVVAFSQSEVTLMSYNILNYPGTDTTTRNPYFRTIFDSVEPDIIVVQEIQSQDGVNGFLNNVLNAASSGFAAGTFINGPDTDNAIFYKSNLFEFISNIPVKTALRDISQFTLVYKPTNDTLIIYSVHLKASTGSANENLRAAEVDSLRKITNALHSGAYFILLGDFNIYHSFEPAYQKLVSTNLPGYVIDPEPLVGTWNNPIYAEYHTQSPRVRAFGGGATGGMDDRFDMVLFSQNVWNNGGITYVQGSTIPYGNDGLHFNDSINRPPNNAVGQIIADALHYASDHIPVLVTLRFDPATIQIPVSLMDGWNLLSVPLHAQDMTGTSLFPTTQSQFFSYDDSYNSVSVLENGHGYWAKFNGNQTATITGSVLYNNEIEVSSGWNLIGPFAFEISVNNITTTPPGIIASPFYGYNSGYEIADTLKPGYGYWIKTNFNGIIHLKK